MTTAINEDKLTEAESSIYGYVDCWTRRWQNYLYFTEMGKMRLASILGYFVGLKHADRPELATRLADNFSLNLDRLCRDRQLMDMRISEAETDTATVSVPSLKVLLADDGSFHNFRFMAYRPLSIPQYDECFAQTFTEQTASAATELDESAIHRLVVAKLNIVERADFNAELTSWRVIGGQHIKVYYVPSYNGGLIYHGPAARHSYSSDNLWSIHT